MGFIGKAWRGQERCWIVYWIYGGVVGIVWQILMTVASKAAPGPVMVGLGILYLVYVIWLLVAQWRCAFNLDWKFWGYVVRGMIVIIPLIVIAGVFTGGLLKGQMLIRAAECKKIMMDANYRAQNPDIYARCMQDPTGAAPQPGSSSMPSAPVKP